jgi:vitamin B12 transporter
LAAAATYTSAAIAAPSAIVSPSPAPSPSASLPEIGRVVTSDRHAEPIGNDTKPTFVVDRSHIDAIGARTVADALVDVPGVNLYSYGAFGSQVNYGIRGSTSAQTLVLVDGFPLTDPTTGSVQIGQLSTIGVSRIEVVESGSSTLYGSSAAGGVINIITSVPRGVYLEAAAGSFGDRDARVGVGTQYAGFTFERHVATNDYPYPAFAYSPATTFAAGTREYAWGDQSAGRAAVDVPLGAYTFRANAYASGFNLGVPGSLAYPSTTATQNTSYTNGLFEVERAFSASRITLSVAGSGTRLAYIDPIGNGGESDVYTGRSQISIKDVITAKNFDAVTGIDASRSSGVFTFPGVPQPSAPPIPPSAVGAAQSQTAAYVQFGASPVRGTRFVAGVRAENDAPAGSILAPSFGGIIHLGSIKLSGNVGESFIVPTLNDLYYPGYSNANLLPEKAQTADVTVAYEGRNGTVSTGWFDRNGSNFIVIAPPLYLPVNAQRASTAGVQLTASTRAYYGLQLEASYTNLYLAIDQTTGNRLPQNPVSQATLSIAHPFRSGKIAYGLNWVIVGSDGDDAGNVSPLASTYDAYSTLNAYVRYRFAPHAIVTVRGLNLANTQYAPVFGYPAPGRGAYVELSTR